MSSTLCLNDATLGPGVQGCRGDFDFTQKFERIFFSIIPAGVFVALAAVRVTVLLSQRRPIVRGLFFQYLKLAAIAVYSLIQCAILILLATGAPGVVHALSVAASSLVFAASLSILTLSYAEHARAARPSALLGCYLLLTLVFDVAQTRTAWLAISTFHHTLLAQLFTASVAIKAAILCLEMTPKTRWIDWAADEHSPEESTSHFSLAAYYWLNRLLVRGYRGILSIDDLYQLDSSMAAEKMHQRLATTMDLHSSKANDKFGLAKDLSRALIGPLLAPIAPRLAFSAFKFCQPFFIDSMLTYLETDIDHEASQGYGLIGASFLIYTGIALSSGIYQYLNQKAVYKARGCLAAAIYRKTIVTKLTGADDSAALTLMSTDVERLILGLEHFHELWAAIIEVAIGCWLLELRIGVAFISPLLIISACACVMWGVLRLVRRRQVAWMEKIQKRVGLTANAISNMKLYKMAGMAGTVTELIQGFRVTEIEVGKRYRWLLIFSATLSFFPLCLSPVVTFAAAGETLNATTLFAALSYILLFTQPMILFFQLLPSILTALACLGRIQAFLAGEPRLDFREFSHQSRLPYVSGEKGAMVSEKRSSESSDFAFVVENASFGWAPNKMTLSNLNVRIPARKLTMVVGPVASGKSTFCKALLGETPEVSGKVAASFQAGSVAYCEQIPFLYNATLRENIIGHCPFVQQKYDSIIRATLLAADLRQLPKGDETRVGSNGIMLSGGQRQRVSVARALYSEAQLLIFDDILSGLDTDTETELFRRVFGQEGLLRQRNATVIICTHSVKHLPTADYIVAFETGGVVVEQGDFTTLSSNNKYIQRLGVKSDIEDSVSTSRAKIERVPTKDVAEGLAADSNDAAEPEFMDKSRQSGDLTVYKEWFGNVSNWSTVALVLTGILYGFTDNFGTVWLKYWSEDSFERNRGFYVGIFAFIKVSQCLVLGLNCVTTFISMITYAGRALHYRAITTVAKAPLKFFTTTDSGVVTNLFSQDMTLIDGELLYSLTNVTLDGSDVVGMMFVIATATPYLAIGYPFLIGALYVIVKFYLRTSRQMRLLDLEAKSPLYTHFMDTIQGVATIRAFGWEHHDIERNNRLLDTSQRPAYLLAMIQKWLYTVLQLFVAGLAVVLVSLATQLSANTGLAGASLVTLLSFGETVTNLIRNWTDLETCIGAVSRLRSFSQTVTPEDKSGENIVPPEAWPQGGRIDLQNVSASYGITPREATAGVAGIESTSNLVMRDLTLTIGPGEKVAICGRTGSGKSSLILLLLRLLDPLDCCVKDLEIDGLPLCKVDRATLRKRLIAVPQDAVFLPDGSSVRANLDPFDEATDEECSSVFEIVQLSAMVEDRGGLQGSMGADDLSAGQKQLFSLGRAILRRRVRDRKIDGNKGGGILLLDEVSSSVDQATDRTMQEIIKNEFQRYTIVMVSHRLQMVMDYFDRVIVLDKGELVESGSPQELVNTPGSRFAELWAMGNGSSDSDSD